MTAYRLHIVASIVWALLIVPTIVWWKDSILWVAFMSIYACIFIHVDGAHSAAAASKEK